VLDEITKLLPDDTWLTQMEVKTQARGKDTQRELLMRGESGNAGRLITLFEESSVFTQAAPRSPTTKIQPGPGEIFDLAAQLRPLPKPAPLEVVAAPSAAVPAAVPGSAAVPTPQAAPASAPPATAAVTVPAVAPAAAPVSPAPPSAPSVPAVQPVRAAEKAAASAPTPTPVPAPRPVELPRTQP